MLFRIINQSIQNKAIVLLLTLALIIWGVFSMMNISIDAVPDITNNQVQIVTNAPSLAAQEVEQFITYPIERNMANVQDVEEIRSISRYGLSVVTVVFKDDVPVLDARQLVGQQLQQAVEEIPAGYGEPALMPITTGLGEIYQYTLEVDEKYKEQYTLIELRTIHDKIIKRQLNGIPGIVEISSFGGLVKEYEIAVNPQLLSSYNLSLLDVNEAVKANNENTGGSYIQSGHKLFYIRAEGLIENIEDIENIVLTNRKGIPILLKDIAEIRIGHPARYGAMTKNGEGETVGGITLMLKGGNASQVIKKVKERIEEVEKNLPKGIHLKPYLDRSELVNRVINTVSTNLIEGGLIVIFILVLLLGNFRAGVIVASVIPLSMLFAFGMMYVFDVTATVMSLGAIDFGLIVDATVIIVESIIHNKEKEKKRISSGQLDEIVLFSTTKIRNSALFGAIIILIVYLPILSLSGIEGKMFKPMALTVSFAIIGALILSFTYVPVMSALILSKKGKTKESLADKLMSFLYKSYNPVFKIALRYKRVVIMFAAVMLVSGVVVFNRMGAEFLPDLDEGDFAMQLTISPGSSLNESIKMTSKAEKVLLDNFPEVEQVISKIGTAEVPTDPMAIEDADVMIILKPKSEWTSADNREELADLMKEKLEVVKGASFEFTQPIQLRFNELLTGAKADVVIKIYGDNLDVLFKKAVEAASIVEKIQGAADVKVEQIDAIPQLIIDYNREKIARYGINIKEINDMVRTALAGEKVGLIFEGEKKFDMVVRLFEEYRNDLNEFKNLYIKSPTGKQVPLDELADIYFKENPPQISRDNTQRRISIGVNVRNRDVQSLVTEIQEKIESQVQLPVGYKYSYGGKFENLNSALNRLKVVVPGALLLIFILLYFAFKSAKQALLIFTTIPLSVIGGIFALSLRGLPFSISAGIGFIALFGVAVLDGIVLLNQLNELKSSGIKNLHRRLILATKSRLRPVTITSAVASLGFIPMAIATGSGAEVQRPLATVVIGGIITGTFLTMVVLPLVYYYFEKGVSIKPNKAITIIAVLLISSVGISAQDTINIDINSAVEILKNKNPEIKNQAIEIEAANLKSKTYSLLGNTDIEADYGKINGANNDYNLSVIQNINNPVEVIRQKQRSKVKAEYERMAANFSLKEKMYLLSDLFIDFNMLESELKILNNQQKELEKIEHILNERIKTNDISSFDLSILNLSIQNQNKQLLEKQVLKSLILNQINILLHATDTVYIPNRVELNDINFPAITEQDLLMADEKVLNAELQILKSKYLPGLYLGVFNQSIDKQTNFSGVKLGLSMPLWFAPNKNQVKIKELEMNQNKNKNSQIKLEKDLLLKSLDEQVRFTEINLDKYNISKLNDIPAQAQLLYISGEININDYLNIITNYINNRFEYNNTKKTLLKLKLKREFYR